VTNDFGTNGYVHLKDFLNKNNCNELVTALKFAIQNGESEKDSQCPISEATYSNSTFDKLLEDLLPHFEKACGKRLLPTYSYARLYKPGEELKKHTDRPACEISATLTLGFEGNPWSIYMAGNKVDMQVGDAVLYKGMEVEHWREKYTEGQWQAQVFLHYVDAEGPHAEWKFDKKQGLSHHFLVNSIPSYIYYDKFISDKFCDLLINEYSKDLENRIPPYIGLKNEIDLSIRSVDRITLKENASIGATLTSVALNTNANTWKYNITHSNQCEFLIYNKDNHYQAHVDMVHKHNEDVRKLTALAFINDDYEGGKFYIQDGPNKLYPPQSKGTIIVFPSYILHGVEPVTKGIRYSCVTWLAGPYFR